MDKVYLTGNTVRLTATFTNNAGVNVDPSLVKIIFYDNKYQKIEEFSISDANRTAVGEYFYDYRIPTTEQRVFYEWYGEIGGNPAIQRDGFVTKFVI